MARGVASPSPASLPKVSFVKVSGENSTTRSGVHDNQQRSYGYNDFSLFERPQHYIRYIEPLESELAVQVEYDMDEQDQDWLDSLNADRKKEQLDKISYEAFEIVMDRLEKEWFDLTKNIPKPDLALPSEDSTCAICDDSEGENTNAIVFCDGCNLAVHQDCYGVPYIPEGQWLCRKCTVSPENAVTCFLCPNEGGAFKQTVHGEWVHLLCAIWIPETRVANEVFMEPITGVERISKQRWKLKCTVCDIREGACIQCSKNSCFLAYHVTCARKLKFLMPMKASSGLEPPPLQCFCEKHMPRERLEARAEALKAEVASEHSEAKSSKSARAYARTYKPGPPVVPSLILSRILQYINKIVMRKRSEFVELVCRYWSLKREARRGAPLLRRLHLEPWTASAGGRVQTDEEKIAKLDLTKCLRKDLADVRTLADLSRKRESRKLRQAQIVQEILSEIIFAHEAGLRMAFENIVAFDRQGFFKNPISKSQVPDYFDIIQQPMWWGAIDEKLDRHEYWDIDTFRADVNLVIENAMRYNKPGTPYYKAAQRIKSNSATLLAELDNLKTLAPLELDGHDDEYTKILLQRNISPIGDLEPPLAVVDLLTSFDIANDLSIVLTSNPLQFLLAYELPEAKPLPLTPAPPTPSSRKTKRERKAELVRRRAELRAARLDTGVNLKPVDPPISTTEEVSNTGTPQTTATEVVLANVDPENTSETEQVLGKRKRTKLASSQPAPDTEVLTDINPKASFALFDKGWILGPGVRRRRVVQLPQPLPKKRTKDHGSPKYEGEIGEEQPDVQERTEPPEPPGLMPAPESDQPTLPLTLAEAKLRLKLEPNMTLSQDPDGKIVIQELDSPVTRREKAMRRKQARSRLAAPAINANSELDCSDLSSLSELSEDEDGSVRIKTKMNETKANAVQPGEVILEDGNMLEGGTLVWAKAKNFPWWAAVIFEPDDPTVPPKVLKSRPTKSKSPMGHHLVRFYDSSKSWQWVELDQLLLLGESDELDQSLLTTSKRQKFSSAKMRQGCRDSYRQAKMEMETEDDVAVEGDMHATSIAEATNVTDELQPVANDNVEMAVLEKEPTAPQ
ncbi:PHD-zinc-finger like domain-containing protein [Lactarius hengduanensis]|nr:PHD-zinc-finger like domain-containing protein [Lactarius hengduanensis]